MKCNTCTCITENILSNDFTRNLSIYIVLLHKTIPPTANVSCHVYSFILNFKFVSFHVILHID